jgi:Fe-S cluster assembly iron-binding protein IscA
MFEISEKASEKIREFLNGREGPQSVRIMMDEGGWKGPNLVMVLDALKENDEIITERGVTFSHGERTL